MDIIELSINDKTLITNIKGDLEMNNGFGKAVKIISKIIEVGSWIGAGITAALIATLAVTGDLGFMKYFTDVTVETTDVSVSGFSIQLLDSNGAPVFAAFMIFFITLLIMLILTALAFRNVNFVFRAAEGSTPFQAEIVEKIKKIGYYFIAMPLAGIVMQIIAGIVIGHGIQVSVEFNNVFVGLVVLALSQFFAYGVKLEDDVEGLV